MSAISETALLGGSVVVAKEPGRLPVYTRTRDGVRGHPYLFLGALAPDVRDYVREGDLATHATDFTDAGTVTRTVDRLTVEVAWPDGRVTMRRSPRIIVWEDDDRLPLLETWRTEKADTVNRALGALAARAFIRTPLPQEPGGAEGRPARLGVPPQMLAHALQEWADELEESEGGGGAETYESRTLRAAANALQALSARPHREVPW